MFNSNSNGYSLADIAAATGNSGSKQDGIWGDGSGAWWIIILFLFCFNGGGWGWGNRGWANGAATASGITDGYILTSDFANIERKIDGVNNGLCDGFYAMNTGMLNGFNAVEQAICNSTINNMQNTNAITAQLTGIGNQINQCCCDQRYESATQFANLNYNIADQGCQTRRAINDSTRDIMANQDANTRSILDFLTQDKIATLTAENQNLKFAASQQAQNAYLVRELKDPCAIPAYVVPNPNCCYYNYGCGGNY